MRTRTIFLVIAIALVAAFVSLNLDEFTKLSTLSLGFTTVQVSLGLVMLVLLALATVVFLASTVYMQSTNLIETRRYARELNAQRELADRAEASRFTELRSYLEMQAQAAQSREAAGGTVLSERFAQQQRALLTRLEQMENSMAAHLGQLQDLLEHRGVIDAQARGEAVRRPLS